MTGLSDAQQWPGRRLGLPEEGPRSIARFGRRLLAITIDWGLAYLLAWLVLRTPEGTPDAFAILGVFAGLQALPLLVIGATAGHLVLRIRVVPVGGGRLAWWRPLWRTVLLCLVIPAVIWDRDQRGVHDRSAGTVLVRI